ncbi:MAG: hypothetical protein KC416_11680 [Myxococcales bacterium]|nr:hypothetical protein [Myxococcales bacterium]
MRFPLAIAAGALLGCTTPSPDPESVAWSAPADEAALPWLLSVWGPSSTELFAVGGSPEEGFLTRYDGSEWRAEDVGEVPLLNWVFGFQVDDVTVVGNGGTILHWDGDTWEKETSPTTQNLWGVWGTSPDNRWAVGGNAVAADGVPTLLHDDGTGWSTVELPPLMRPKVYALFKVWGTDENNVYAVGQRGTVLHWDGSVLTEELVGTGEDLISLWGSGRDRIMAVGGRSNGVVVLWNGDAWSSLAFDNEFPLPALNGIWMDPLGQSFVVGIEGTIAQITPDSTRYARQSIDSRLTFHGVFGDGERITAVGGNLANPMGPFRGILRTRPK